VASCDIDCQFEGDCWRWLASEAVEGERAMEEAEPVRCMDPKSIACWVLEGRAQTKKAVSILGGVSCWTQRAASAGFGGPLTRARR
jgi:hypothetical protein